MFSTGGLRNAFEGYRGAFNGKQYVTAPDASRGFEWSPYNSWNGNGYLSYESKRLSAYYTYSHYQSALTFYGHIVQQEFDDGVPLPLYTATDYDYQVESNRHHLHVQGKWWRNAAITIDLSYQNNWVVSVAGFTGLHWQLHPRWSMQPGVRLSGNGLYKTWFSGALAVNYDAGRHHHFKLLMEQVRRFPNYRELFTYLESEYNLLEGDRQLKLETGRVWYLSQFRVLNAAKAGDYYYGMPVDIEVADDPAKDFGDPSERCLAAALGNVHAKMANPAATKAIIPANMQGANGHRFRLK